MVYDQIDLDLPLDRSGPSKMYQECMTVHYRTQFLARGKCCQFFVVLISMEMPALKSLFVLSLFKILTVYASFLVF